MISAQDAEKIIWNALSPLAPERVPLERSLRRVLAEPVLAAEAVPPFDNAAMDGFAVRSADTDAAPATLSVSGEIAAGSTGGPRLEKMSAIRIMTGGAIPTGCDAVVQKEWTEDDEADVVRVLRRVPPAHNVRRAGSDIPKGSLVLSPGAVLRPQEIGLLASLGKLSVLAAQTNLV